MDLFSCIYVGSVCHRRVEPVRHEFRFPLFMMYVDLDELPTVLDRYWFWSARRPNLAWFRRRDYLDGKSTDLATAVRELIRQQLGEICEGPIRMLTHFRYFGFVINPISLYYCFNRNAEIEFVVVEVTNTPWGEKHAYVFRARPDQDAIMNFASEKRMHVSPFMSMEYQHRFGLNEPGKQLFLQIENHRQVTSPEPVDEEPFCATLALKSIPLNSPNLARVLARYPWMTLQVVIGIYWQAFRLWMKKVKFHKHPGKREPVNKSVAV